DSGSGGVTPVEVRLLSTAFGFVTKASGKSPPTRRVLVILHRRTDRPPSQYTRNQHRPLPKESVRMHLARLTHLAAIAISAGAALAAQPEAPAAETPASFAQQKAATPSPVVSADRVT